MKVLVPDDMAEKIKCVDQFNNNDGDKSRID